MVYWSTCCTGTILLLYCLAFALGRFSIGLAFAVYGEIAADLVLVAGNGGGVRGDPDACVSGVLRRFLPPPRQGWLLSLCSREAAAEVSPTDSMEARGFSTLEW